MNDQTSDGINIQNLILEETKIIKSLDNQNVVKLIEIASGEYVKASGSK